MNSCSELIASYYVRSSFAFQMSCHALIAMIVVYYCYPPFNLRLTPLLPPTTPLPSTTTSSTTVPLPSSFQASSVTSPLPHIAYLSIFICCTRHMLLLVTFLFKCIAFHCHHLFTFSDILCSL